MIRQRILSVKEYSKNTENPILEAPQSQQQALSTTTTQQKNPSKQQQSSTCATSQLSSSRTHRAGPKQPQLLQSFDFQKWFFSRYRERANVNYLWKAHQLYEKDELELLFQTILKNSPEIYQPKSSNNEDANGSSSNNNNNEGGNSNDNDDDDDEEEIHLEAFYQVMKKQGKENFMDRKTFDQVIQLIDRDGNRMLNKNEFYTMLMSKSINYFFIKLNKESWIKNNLANQTTNVQNTASSAALHRSKKGIQVKSTAATVVAAETCQSEKATITTIDATSAGAVTDQKQNEIVEQGMTMKRSTSEKENIVAELGNQQRIDEQNSSTRIPNNSTNNYSGVTRSNLLRFTKQTSNRFAAVATTSSATATAAPAAAVLTAAPTSQQQNPTVRRRRNTSSVMVFSGLDKQSNATSTSNLDCIKQQQSSLTVGAQKQENPEQQQQQQQSQQKKQSTFKQLDLSRVIGSLKYESEREQLLRQFERIRHDKSVDFEQKYATVNSLLNQPHFSVSNIGLSVTESLLTKQQIQSARDSARRRSRRKLVSMDQQTASSSTTLINPNSATLESSRYHTTSSAQLSSADPRSGLSTAGNTTITTNQNFYDVQVDENHFFQYPTGTSAAIISAQVSLNSSNMKNPTTMMRPLTEGHSKRNTSLPNVMRIGSSIESVATYEKATTSIPALSTAAERINITIQNAVATSSIIEKRREQLMKPKLTAGQQNSLHAQQDELQQKYLLQVPSERYSRQMTAAPTFATSVVGTCVKNEKVKVNSIGNKGKNGKGEDRYNQNENFNRSLTAESMGDRVSTAAGGEDPELDLQDCFRKTFRLARRYTKQPTTSSQLFNNYLNASACARVQSPLKHAVTCQIRNDPPREFSISKLKHAKTHAPKSILRESNGASSYDYSYEQQQQQCGTEEAQQASFYQKKKTQNLEFLSRNEIAIE